MTQTGKEQTLNNINDAILGLLNSEPFYAHFILGCRILYDRFQVPTMAVCFIQGVPTLIVNSEFYLGLKQSQRIAVLKHEVLHFVFNHLSSYKQGHSHSKDNMLRNFAQDCAINQYIQNLPAECILPETMEKSLKLAPNTLERFQTSEYYFNFLKQNEDKIPKDPNGEGYGGMETLDEHGVSGKDGDLEVDEASGKMQDIVAKDLTRRALNQSKGQMSQDLIKAIGEMLKDSKVNWKQILRNFVARSTTTLREGTRKKRHRRYGLQFPGVKKKRLMKLGVCVDTSSSVGDEEFIQFMNEIQAMLKSGQVAEVHMVQADAEVKKVVKLVPGKSKIEFERAGYGGTAYDPALKKCVELGCSAIVYLGDMDTADTPDEPPVPVLWVTTRTEVRPGNFGEMIKIEAD